MPVLIAIVATLLTWQRTEHAPSVHTMHLSKCTWADSSAELASIGMIRQHVCRLATWLDVEHFVLRYGKSACILGLLQWPTMRCDKVPSMYSGQWHIG